MKLNKTKLIQIGVLFVILLLFPIFVSNPYYLHLVNLIIVYSMITVGLNLITGVTGQVSLGHAAFWGIGAYVAAFITTTLGISFWFAVPLAILVTGIIGLIIGSFTLHLKGPYLAMATIGVGEITRIVLINWDSFSGGPSGIYGIPYISIGSFEIDSEMKFYYFALVSLIIVYMLCHRIIFSRIGRSMIAIRENEGAAQAVGVDTTKMKVMIFGISTAIAGFAGAIYAHWINYISPGTFSFEESLLFLTMIMIGGMGSLPASIIGAGSLVILSEILRDINQFRMIVYALLIISVIVFFPEGIIAMIPKRFRKGAVYPDYEQEESQSFQQKLNIDQQNHGQVLLKASGILKRFGGLTAVNKVNLELRQGEIRALIGPNGSGKTTFLNCMAGWYEVDEGQIELRGKDISYMPIHQRAKSGIARTFQNILLFNDMTVLENILVAINDKRKKEKQLVQDAYDLLHFVDLEKYAHEKVSNLPYGHQRTVEIGRALALSPQMLLLDEPAAGMNDSETANLMKLIYKIREIGITVLVVEHDMKLIMGIADYITVLNQGEVLAQGTPKEISQNPDVIEAYLGRSAENAVN